MNKLFLAVAIAFIVSCTSGKPESKTVREKESLQFMEVTLTSPTSNSLRGISVLDDDNAWLSGAKGTILMTTDAGQNWQLLTSPDNDSLDFRSIHAFDANTAIVASAGFPSRIYKTSNAGETWNLVYENSDSAAFINSIAFRNDQSGIALGDQLNGRHLMLQTNDAGDSWTLIDSSFIPKPLTVENAFAASGSCIALLNDDYFIGFGGEKSRIFSSLNNNDWQATPTPMKAGLPSQGIYSIASGAELLMAVGGDYTTPDSSHSPIYSNDTGKTWHKSSGKLSGYRSVVDYAEQAKTWVAAGTNGIDVSTDKGKSWRKMSDQDINTLRFAPNSTRAFAASKNGELFILDVKLTLKKY